MRDLWADDQNPTPDMLKQKTEEQTAQGGTAIIGLDETQTGLFLDKDGAIESVCREIAKETGRSTEDFADILFEHQYNKEFWERCKLKGRGLVLEGNTRARCARPQFSND